MKIALQTVTAAVTVAWITPGLGRVVCGAEPKARGREVTEG